MMVAKIIEDARARDAAKARALRAIVAKLRTWRYRRRGLEYLGAEALLALDAAKFDDICEILEKAGLLEKEEEK